MREGLTIERAADGDMGLVYSSWIQSSHNGPWALQAPTLPCARGHHRIVRGILARPTTQVLVARPVGHTTDITGWACIERWPEPLRDVQHLLHYVYVKKPFRRFGVAETLLREAFPGDATVWGTWVTFAWAEIFKPRYGQAPITEKRLAGCSWRSNPYLAIFPEP